MITTLKTVKTTPLPMLLCLLLGACGGYNTDLPPPNGKETYAEVLPPSLGGQTMAIQHMQLDAARFHGARAHYGDAVSVEIVEVRSATDLDTYVRQNIKPRLAKYPNRSSGKFNGVWSLRGSGATGRMHAWQNHNWLFVIEATNDALFEETVDHFAYINRR